MTHSLEPGMSATRLLAKGARRHVDASGSVVLGFPKQAVTGMS